jgi:hypothetical protein
MGKTEQDAIKPNYYKSGDQDAIAYTLKHNLNFTKGSVLKYMTRAGNKDGESELKDLNKALEYLKREINYIKQRDEN